MVTLVGLQAPLLIGGAVIMEQIFVIPGMGLLLLEAVSQRDYPIITGVFLVVGVAVMLINLAGRPQLRAARSQGEVPLMVAVAETVRAPRAPRRAAAARCRFLGRLFRDKPLGAFGGVICVLFLFCGVFADVLAPYGMQPDQPDQPAEAAVVGSSGSAPTISAATCSRAASTARSSR